MPPLVAVPVAEAAGWQVSLGEWASSPPSRSCRGSRWCCTRAARGRPRCPRRRSAGLLRYAVRSPLAWALTIVFTIPGFNAYAMFAWLPPILHDIAGTSPVEAGALLSLFAAMGLPASIVVPVIAARYGHVRLLVGIAIVSFAAGYLGLLLVPATATWLWVALVGTGPLLFPLTLVLINLRSRTHSGAVALSGFVQSVGYLIVAIGPLAVGLLHESTGGWTWPLIFLASSIVPAAIAGTIAARPRYFEDERAA